MAARFGAGAALRDLIRVRAALRVGDDLKRMLDVGRAFCVGPLRWDGRLLAAEVGLRRV